MYHNVIWIPGYWLILQTVTENGQSFGISGTMYYLLFSWGLVVVYIYIYLVENLNRPLDPISLVSIQCTTRFVVIPRITIPEILLTQQQSDSYFWREIWNQPTVQCTYQNTLASVIHVLKYCIQYVLGLFTSAATIILIGYCNNKTQMLLDFG